MTPTVRATYRLQLTPSFGLDAAADLVPHLARLGISHLYTSPLSEATPGSAHGYDVTDHGRVRGELGGPDALRRLWEALDRHGMGHVVDLVPNHMGIRSPRTAGGRTCSRAGRASPYAAFFDVEWDPPDPVSRDRVVLPFLGAPLPEVLARGELGLADDDPPGRGAPDDEPAHGPPRLVVTHHDDRWPLREDSVAALGLPSGDGAGAGPRPRRRPRPHGRAARRPALAGRALARGGTLLNWRRFFDVTDLAAVQVERPEVFDAVHALLRSWLDDELGRAGPPGGPDRPRRRPGRPRAPTSSGSATSSVPVRLLVVEKILATDEALPPTVAGRRHHGLRGARPHRPGAHRPRRRRAPPSRHSPRLHRGRHAVRRGRAVLPPAGGRRAAPAGGGPAGPGVRRLRRDRRDRSARRSRTPRRGGGAGPGARRLPGLPARRERRSRPPARRRRGRPGRPGAARPGPTSSTPPTTCSPQAAAPAPPPTPSATRFSQLTAPLAAKAVEDTAFYREVTLPWLTEVGGDPGRPSRRPPTRCTRRWRHSATPGRAPSVPLSTHDTKRSGDVRARITRLAADPDGLPRRPGRLARGAASATGARRSRTPRSSGCCGPPSWGRGPSRRPDGRTSPPRPSARPSQHTSGRPRPDHEAAVRRFAGRVLADAASSTSIDHVRRPHPPRGPGGLARAGRAGRHRLGTPDLYQGDELWNLALVDPDNRRPVDHDAALAACSTSSRPGPSLPSCWRDSRRRPRRPRRWRSSTSGSGCCRLREQQPEAFRHPYRPRSLEGPGGGDASSPTSGATTCSSWSRCGPFAPAGRRRSRCGAARGPTCSRAAPRPPAPDRWPTCSPSSPSRCSPRPLPLT